LGVRYLRKVVEGKITDPLLLVGEEGVGRRFSVAEAAKELWSKGNPSSPHCYQVDHGVHPDFILVKPQEGKEIGVDTVRGLIRSTVTFPSLAKTRFVLVDGADRMTSAAGNALLKTLEQPPKRTQFFLLVERAEAVLPTIRSRCGEVRYNRLSEEFVKKVLTGDDESGMDPLRALVYTRLAEGSIGRAVSYSGAGVLDLRNRILSIVKLGLSGDLSLIFSSVDNLYSKKPEDDELSLGLRFLDFLVRDLVMVKYDSSRLVNADLLEELEVLRGQLGDNRLMALQDGLKIFQDRSRGKINIPFHVKSLFATVFCG
jgi:DNA polymerase-3 subunit delta'